MHRPGFVFWCAIGACITVYEVLAPEGEMMSHTVDRGLERHPYLVTGAIVVTAAHLLNVLDRAPWMDPYQILARMRQLRADI